MTITSALAARLLWLAAFSTFVGGGIGLVWWPGEREIGSLRSAAANLYEESNRNEAEVRDAASLRVVQRRLLADLGSLASASSQAAGTARLLHLLAQASTQHHLRVRSIVPGEAAEPAARSTTAPAGGLEQTSVDIVVEGSFFDVLAFASDLPRHDALIGMDDIDLGTSSVSDADPLLLATLHTTLYRLHRTLPPENEHASSSL